MEKYYFILNWKMSILSQKLQQATRLFQTHNFKKSLQAYEDCINFCYKTDESQSIVFNILSTKATLQYILGDYDQSLITLNSVLKKDPCHFLSLSRRSQVYKKKNKLKKALKDLQTIYVFCPDNLQISAFKVEIEHLILKQQKQHQITSESQNEEDQEDQLNFIKLKQIDRKSSDFSAIKQRKIRVTILGDTTFEYKCEQQTAQSKDSENVQQKAIRTYKEIELDDDDDENDTFPIINIKPPARRGKSILKNKGTNSIFIRNEDPQVRRSRYLGRESKFSILVKNIDGKVIVSAQHDHQCNPQMKEVQFRKSISQVNQLLNVPSDNHSMTSSRQRKSCLKRPSFQVPTVKGQVLRRSRFQSIEASKIDGHIIAHTHKRKSIDRPQSEANSEGQMDELKQNTDSDSDGSEHNIFGSKQFVMSQDLRQQLGFNDNHDMSQSHDYSNSKLKSKKSILKKNSSVLMTSPNPKKSYIQHQDLAKSNMSLRSKKSVIFNCTL